MKNGNIGAKLDEGRIRIHFRRKQNFNLPSNASISKFGKERGPGKFVENS